MTETFTRILSYYARPESFSTGGVNTSRQQWMKALAQQGYNVEILSALGGFDEELVQDERITFRSIAHFGRGRMTMVPLGLGRLLKRGDLVYLHEGWTLSNLVAAWTCRARRVDYIVMPHGVYSPSIVSALRLVRIRRTLESKILAHARAVHLFFDSERSELEAVSPSARAVIAVTGLDLPDLRWQPNADEPYVAWIGRYDIEHKGIDLLLEALASLPEGERPSLRMHGPDHRGDQARVEELVRRWDLAKWVTVGRELSRPEVLPFLASSQGLIHVPRWEAFGRTIVEALSLGCPIAVSDSAHISTELLAARAARIVEGANVSSIAEGLQELHKGQVGTGEAGRNWVANTLSWPAVSRNLIERSASK